MGDAGEPLGRTSRAARGDHDHDPRGPAADTPFAATYSASPPSPKLPVTATLGSQPHAADRPLPPLLRPPHGAASGAAAAAASPRGKGSGTAAAPASNLGRGSQPGSVAGGNLAAAASNAALGLPLGVRPDLEADVVVLGAGITGLATALALKRVMPRLRVKVGASGGWVCWAAGMMRGEGARM